MSEPLIPAVLEHRFQVSQLSSIAPEDCCPAPTTSVVHNGVRLDFSLCLNPNQLAEHLRDKMGVFVNYVDGPKPSTKLICDFFVVKDSEQIARERIGSVSDGRDFNRGGHENGAWGRPAALPSSVETLAQQHYLTAQGTVLHVIALLLIPESAFSDPELNYQASPSRISNDFSNSLHSQIRTPVDTNSSYKVNNRFELISRDGHHFYVHKDMLSFSSDVFKQMFDIDKPPEAQFRFIKEGRMEVAISGGALNQMLSYVYLGHATVELDTFAVELLESTEMYGLHGLKLMCEQKIIQQMNSVQNITDLMSYLQLSDTHKLTALTEASLQNIKKLVIQQDETSVDELVKLLDLASEHKNGELAAACENQLTLLINPQLTMEGVLSYVSIARDYKLKNLLEECTKWFGNQWPTLIIDGLDGLMEDKTDGRITMVMGEALAAYASDHVMTE